VTYRTYPSLHVAAAVIVIKTVSANTTQALFTEFLRMTPPLSAAGWAGCGRVTNNNISFLCIAPNVSATIASESIQPFFEYLVVYPEGRHDGKARIRSSCLWLCSVWRLLSPHHTLLQQARLARALQPFFSPPSTPLSSITSRIVAAYITFF